MINSVLIANRGEIACRIIRTARRMGLRTIAVYSRADARALHVRMADEAHYIGAAPAVDSYLRGDTILSVARATGAQVPCRDFGCASFCNCLRVTSRALAQALRFERRERQRKDLVRVLGTRRPF